MSADNVPISFLMQVMGSEEVQQKIGALGGALQQFDAKAAATAQTTGQTLPAGFDATSKGAERANKSVQSAGQGFQTAALGLTSAASGAFALYNQYDRLEKVQLRIATGEKAVTTAERASLDSKRALNDLVAKGITTGAQYESAVLRVSQAEQEQAIAADRLNIAQNDLTQGQIGFALTVMPTVFSAVSGVRSAMDWFHAAQVRATASTRVLAPALVGSAGAMGVHAGAATVAGTATGGLSLAMRVLHIAMGPVGWIILAIGAAMTLFATNAFGVRDAINAAGKAIGDAVPGLRALLEPLQTLANTIFPDAASESKAFAQQSEEDMKKYAGSVVSGVATAESALERLKRAFDDASATSGRAIQTPTRSNIEETDSDPLLGRIVAGLSGKRLEVAEEKRKIVAEVVELVSGIRTELADIPTDLPALSDLMDNIRSELRDTLSIDFDFDSEDIGAELDELKDGLSKRVGPLHLLLQIQHDELDRELDSVVSQIEKTEERIRTLSGGRGLDELRESFAAGTLTEGGDEFVVHMLAKLDSLGEKAVEIKGKLRDITHVEFEPFSATDSAATGAGSSIVEKMEKDYQAIIDLRIKTIEEIESLVRGSQQTLTEAAKKDIPGLKGLLEGQLAALKEELNFDLAPALKNAEINPENFELAMEQLREAIAKAKAGATADAAELATGVDSALEGVATSASQTGSEVEAGMSAATSAVASSTSKINDSVFEMRGVFLQSFNVILDAMTVFSRGIDKHSDAVISDLKRMEKELDDVGLGGSSARRLVESSTSRSTRSSSGGEVKINNVIQLDGQELKSWLKKAAVENIGGNL